MTLGYRGTHYAGWAVQTRARDRPRSRRTLESRSRRGARPSRPCDRGRPHRRRRACRGSGRLLRHVLVDSRRRACSGSCALALPDDIWVDDVAEAAPSFDARRSARRRWYRYAIWRARRAVRRAGTAAALVDARAARPCARCATRSRALLGRHDFAALATRPPRRTSTDAHDLRRRLAASSARRCCSSRSAPTRS